jgi:inhibitor of cysteine peptidase
MGSDRPRRQAQGSGRPVTSGDAGGDARCRAGAAYRVALTLALCSALTACIVAPPRELDASSDNTRVVLEPHQELVVRLETHPETGYRWSVERGAATVLLPADDPNYEPVFASAPLVGSGGWTRFRYRASALGSDTLELVYRRPWEKSAVPAKTYRVDVVVQKP